MGETAMDGLSDRGSIPLSSIFVSTAAGLMGSAVFCFT